MTYYYYFVTYYMRETRGAQRVGYGNTEIRSPAIVTTFEQVRAFERVLTEAQPDFQFTLLDYKLLRSDDAA